MRSSFRNFMSLTGKDKKQGGFTLVELMIVILIMGVLAGLAVPVYADSRKMAKRNACNYAQRQIESALVQWRFINNEDFITGNCLPGDGEAYLDLDGNVPGEPARSLTNLKKGKFDCPSNGEGVGQISGCDYITDGYTVACLTDNSVGTRFDGSPFMHDQPQGVDWKHIIGVSEEVEEQASPLGDTFAEIMDSLIAMLEEYYEKNGEWPPNNFDKWCEALGVDPDVLGEDINGLNIRPKGSTIEVTPDKDQTITVKGVNGKEYTVTDKKGKLVYDAKTDKWYYNTVHPRNEVDISTMDISKS